MRDDDLRALDPVGTRPILVLERCDSTNRVARALAEEGDGTDPVVVAEEQTAGRGRQGRTWTSEAGLNLTFSLVMRPPVPAERAPRLVLAWAAAMAAALDVSVKWPNDLVDGADRKLGGVLAELEADGREVRFLVLGVGLNINQELFPGLPGATSLRLARGAVQDRAATLRAVVSALDAVNPHDPALLDGWRARARTLGRRVRVAGREGVASALREDGALVVDGHPVLAGDVELL